MVEPLPPQFDADELTGGAVSKDGASAVIELVNDEQRLWVSLPIASLKGLSALCSDLQALGLDAKNGVANQWHVSLRE
jgi:hypothetical protein